MLGLEVIVYPNVRCSQIFRFFYFLQNGCFHHKVWGCEFFWKVMDVRLLKAVILCKTLRGPQLDLGLVEAVEGPKMAMLKKLRLVTIFKSGIKKLGDH